MAWNELVAKRGRGTKVFQDSVDPARYSLDSQAGTVWHYGDDFANEVDLTPQRVLASGHDGWRVTNNGWHYFLGQPNGLADGFVGFGGRQGDKWLLFRLARVGYIHWPTRAWDDIGGEPDYDRANLSQQTNETTVPTTGETIPVEAVATWSDLWNTPGGGALDVSWKINGNGLKEEVTINQAARTWIGANRPPSTPASETYFSFVFRLGSAPDVNNIEMDLSYLPRWLKDGVLQNTEGDFDDDDGTQPIEVRNALDEFLFLLPIDEAYVEEIDGEGEITRTSINLRKRIYKDGSDYYLLVGAKVTDLAGMPAGDLVFDPTVDYQVGASEDDGGELVSGNVDIDDVSVCVDAVGEIYGARWTGVTIPAGATINSAYVDGKISNAAHDEPYVTVDFEDGIAPAVFVAGSGTFTISGRTGTTATVNYGDGTAINANLDDWLSAVGGGEQIVVTSIIQELQASYDYSGGEPMLCRIAARGTGAEDLGLYFYDNAAADAAKLHIDYTAGGGVDITVPVGVLEITGYAPAVTTTAHVDIEIPVAALEITGYAPVVTTTAHVDIEVPAGVLEITGYAPVVTTTAHVDIEIPVGVLEITGYAPTVTATAHIDIEVPVGVLEIAGYAPVVTVSAHIDIEVPTGAIEIEGFAPTVTVTGSVDVEVPTGALVVTGYAPTVTTTGGVDVEVPVASIVLTGYAPIVTTLVGTVEIELWNRAASLHLNERTPELVVGLRKTELVLEEK